MKTTDEILAYLLGCDSDEIEALNTIMYPVEDIFFGAEAKDLKGICESVYKAATAYLIQMLNFAKEKIRENPRAYVDVALLHWDPNLLQEALEYLNPKKDLSYGLDKTEFYLELNNWMLYDSVVDTICDDYGFDKTFDDFMCDFTSKVYSGEAIPDKFESLI